MPLRDLGLVASEGRLTLPLVDGSAAGVLAIDAGFYEFIPEEAMDAGAPPVLLAHELEVGRRYGIVLSGANGLYRYDLNDIVEVRGYYRRTPLVAFVRKGRDMTSITGEKLHLNHVRAAVRAAEDATRVEVWQFRLIPDVETCRYDLLVEPRGAGLDAHRGRGVRAGGRRGARPGQRRVRGEATLAPARAPAPLRHAGGVGRAAVPGRVRARPAGGAAQVAGDPARVGRGEPRRGRPNLGGGSRMTRETARRAGQALLWWGAVGGPILAWWPGALRLPALWAVVVLGVLANALQPSYRSGTPPGHRRIAAHSARSCSPSMAARRPRSSSSSCAGPRGFPSTRSGTGALLAMGAGLALRTWAIATLGGWFTLRVGVTPAQRLVQDGAVPR